MVHSKENPCIININAINNTATIPPTSIKFFFHGLGVGLGVGVGSGIGVGPGVGVGAGVGVGGWICEMVVSSVLVESAETKSRTVG